MFPQLADPAGARPRLAALLVRGVTPDRRVGDTCRWRLRPSRQPAGRRDEVALDASGSQGQEPGQSVPTVVSKAPPVVTVPPAESAMQPGLTRNRPTAVKLPDADASISPPPPRA